MYYVTSFFFPSPHVVLWLNSGSWPPLTGLCNYTHWIHHFQYDSPGQVIIPTKELPPDNAHTSMPPARFKPTIPASERLQTRTLDRGATGMGNAVSSLLYLHDIILKDSKNFNIINFQFKLWLVIHSINLYNFLSASVTQWHNDRFNPSYCWSLNFNYCQGQGSFKLKLPKKCTEVGNM